MSRVIATIAPDGTVTFKVEGISGPTCKDLTASLQKAVGTTTRDVKTAEYFETASAEKELRKESA